MARAWSDADEIRRFVGAVRAALPDGAPTERTAAWLRWADKYVRAIDPLAHPDDVPKEIEPTDEQILRGA